MSISVKFVKILSPIALAIALSACGGGSADFGSNTGSGSDSTDTDTTDTGIVVAEELVYSLQELDVGITTLSAGGSTGVTTRLIDQNDDYAQVEKTVSFTSPCISDGTAEIDSPIVSNNGVFTTTYTAIGCEGDDTITATIDGLSVEETVTVEAASLGQVEFVSAEPQNILLSGMSATGLQHTSTVTFQILNDVGGPIADEDVTFSLSTDVGGITLASEIGKTDNKGYVSTILEAGTINTPVRVTATVDRGDKLITSQSSQLVISTGIADQNSLSLSLSNHTPSGWDHDGEEVSVNIYASDRFNNLVPDGTTVIFNTELGQIEPSCQTVSGRCSVKWRSSEPRVLGIATAGYTYNDDGKTTITASVIGEESFIDTNSNGVFDDGDIFDTNSDLGESYEDYNEDGVYNEGYEKYLDFDRSNSRDSSDSKYTGLGCMHSTDCFAENGLKHIFASTYLTMAEDTQQIHVYDSSGSEVNTVIEGESYDIVVSGARNNGAPPSGTSIAISSDEAEIVTESSITVPVTSGPYGIALSVKDADDDTVTGRIKITVTTPKGIIVIKSVAYIDAP